MADRLSVGGSVAVLYLARRAPGYAKEWFVVHNSNPGGELCDAASVRELYTSEVYVHEGRIEIRCTGFWSSLHDQIHEGGYGINRWPGQTLSIPAADDIKDKYDDFILELLTCMHTAMTSGMHVPREPYPRARRGEQDLDEDRHRRHEAAVGRLRRSNTWGRPGRGGREGPAVEPGRPGRGDLPHGESLQRAGRGEPTFDRATTKKFLEFVERAVDQYFDRAGVEPR